MHPKTNDTKGEIAVQKDWIFAIHGMAKSVESLT